MGKLAKLIWFSTKAGLCFGSVYVTVDQGVWGTPDQSIALASKVYESVPGLKSFKEEYLSEYMPRSRNVNINFKHYWNSAILCTGDFLAESPTKVVQLKDYVVGAVTSLTSEAISTEKKDQKL